MNATGNQSIFESIQPSCHNIYSALDVTEVIARLDKNMVSSQTILNGQEFLKNRHTIILGVSSGNPYYYNVENLQRLFQFGDENSDKVLVFLPDKISEHSYRALGSKNPERSARSNANRLRNKCKTAIQETKPHDTSLDFIRWMEEVETSEEYKEAFNNIKRLYHSNDGFRTDIMESTGAVLRCLKTGRKKGGSDEISDGDEEMALNLEEGVKYLLKELAFFVAAPSIREECEEFVLVYHRPWPVLERFFDGYYDGIPRPYLGYVVFRRS